MSYNYFDLSFDELIKRYNSNKESINYYKSKMEQEENLEYLFLIIFFVGALLFSAIGIYYFFESNILRLIIGFIFLLMLIRFLRNLDIFSEYKLHIALLEEENDFIANMLENKYKYSKIS